MGTKIGLGVSGFIIVVAVALFAWFSFGGGSIGNPTSATTGAGKLNAIELSLDARDLVQAKEGSGAEKLYEEAVAAMMKGGDPGEFLKRVKGTLEPEKNPDFKPLLDKLEQAADMGMSHDTELNFKALPVNPLTDSGARDGLYGLALIASNAGMSARSDKHQAESERALKACYIFGERLWNNGVYVAYKQAGLGAMSMALAGYARHYDKDFFNDPAKASKARDLENELKEVSNRWMEKQRTTYRSLPLNVGDLANLADHDKDRAWRIEGLMWMGVGQWSSVGGNSRKAVNKFLDEHASAGDPLIAQTAKEARDFPRSNVQMIPAGE